MSPSMKKQIRPTEVQVRRPLRYSIAVVNCGEKKQLLSWADPERVQRSHYYSTGPGHGYCPTWCMMSVFFACTNLEGDPEPADRIPPA